MIRRVILLAAALPLAGCGASLLPWAVASGGILTGVAGVTNADVSLFKAYIDWRTASSTPTTGAASTPAATH